MRETVDILVERITKVENTLSVVESQLSLLISKLISVQQLIDQKEELIGKPVYANKDETAKIFRLFLERNGIQDLNPISIEKLHESMARNGLNSEDNEFSQTIIKERDR